VHIAACWIGRYNAADEYFGGIVAFNRADFERINGYPNNCPGLPGASAHSVLRSKLLLLALCVGAQGA
jgi:hypothetical protein